MDGYGIGVRGINIQGTDTVLSLSRNASGDVIVTPISKTELTSDSLGSVIVRAVIIALLCIVVFETAFELNAEGWLRVWIYFIIFCVSLTGSSLFQKLLFKKVDFQEGGTLEDKAFFNDVSVLPTVTLDKTMFFKKDRDVIEAYLDAATPNFNDWIAD